MFGIDCYPLFTKIEGISSIRGEITFDIFLQIIRENYAEMEDSLAKACTKHLKYDYIPDVVVTSSGLVHAKSLVYIFIKSNADVAVSHDRLVKHEHVLRDLALTLKYGESIIRIIKIDGLFVIRFHEIFETKEKMYEKYSPYDIKTTERIDDENVFKLYR